MTHSVIAVLPDFSDSSFILENLGRDGIDVRVASSPEDALTLLASGSADVLLYDADTGQPWRDALPRFVKAKPGVRVVLLTQSANQRTWLDLFDGGGFDLLLRPLRPVDLRAVVRCALDPPRFFHQAA
jgi:DNA-binding NtrC family response regulator